VDLELISAAVDASKLLGQFGALLAAFSFLLVGSAKGYAQSTAPPAEVLVSAGDAEQFPDSVTMLALAYSPYFLGIRRSRTGVMFSSWVRCLYVHELYSYPRWRLR
jgi:hypothetical protein